MAPVATEFEKIIHTARERKKNEALADKIFSTNRREPKSAPRGSLASRVGIKKPQQTNNKPAQRQRASIPAGDVNGEWTHDLHNAHDDSPRNRSLRSRISQPAHYANGNGNGNGNGNTRANSHANSHSHSHSSATAHTSAQQRSNRKRAAQLSAALDRMDTDAHVAAEPRKQSTSPTPAAAKPGPAPGGISIRGIAGPFAVLAQNFAPGTTAADIESAMTPVGGEMVSCAIIKTQPMMLVEMVFSSREGGERVIQTFHNKTAADTLPKADGRVIQVFAKPGGYSYQPDHAARNGAQTHTQTYAQTPSYSHAHAHAHANRDQIVDGRNGFSEDLMTVDHNTASSSGGGDRFFYIDKSGPVNKRGRGFQRGQGGR